MANGIEIINQNNHIQISSNYQNFALKEVKRKLKGTDFLHSGAFFAIKPDINTTGVSNICSAYSNKDHNFGNATAYVFDQANNVSSNTNVGLQIFKDNGDVAFDSNLRYMRVIDSSFKQKSLNSGVRVWWNNPLYGNHEGFRYTLNYGHPNIAVVFMNSYKEEEDDFWDGNYWRYSLMSAVEMKSNNDLAISDFYGFSQPDSYKPPSIRDYGYSSSCEWLVLDVTGY